MNSFGMCKRCKVSRLRMRVEFDGYYKMVCSDTVVCKYISMESQKPLPDYIIKRLISASKNI